jgi:hypothetical protein
MYAETRVEIVGMRSSVPRDGFVHIVRVGTGSDADRLIYASKSAQDAALQGSPERWSKAVANGRLLVLTVVRTAG